MFVFPGNTITDLVRNNMQSQFSLLLNLSKTMVNTSVQLGELNVHAGRKLMEESAAALQKALQLKTPADTQSFIAEQSQVTIDRIRGYALNVQNIASQNWTGVTKPGRENPAAYASEPDKANGDAAQEDAASLGQHDVDVHPSALVEKLVASAVKDVDKLH